LIHNLELAYTLYSDLRTHRYDSNSCHLWSV